MPQFPQITSNLSTANFRLSVLTQLAEGIPVTVSGSSGSARATTATRSNFSANTSTQIAPSSATRASLAVFNVGPAVLYIGQGSTTVSAADFTYLLNPGDTYIAEPNEVGLEHRAIFAATGSNAEVTIGS
jgi:hypothetical protein